MFYWKDSVFNWANFKGIRSVWCQEHDCCARCVYASWWGRERTVVWNLINIYCSLLYHFCQIYSRTWRKIVVKSSKWWIIKFIQTFALKPLLEMILPCWNGEILEANTNFGQILADLTFFLKLWFLKYVLFSIGFPYKAFEWVRTGDWICSPRMFTVWSLY